ncbi:MAG TPA: amidohydrolase, partial [Blastocatellia bacterium]|nr:amidohydrolase [Blastocatellia bacterium]
MKFSRLLVLSLCAILSVSALLPGSQAAINTLPNASRDEVFAKDIEAMFPRLVETRRDFHMHPELSNQEVRTSRVIAEKLRALGLEVKTGIARHGVIGLLKGGKSGGVVAIRADMDALPINELNNVPYKSQNKDVMHACGHDIHMTVALGVAELLAKHRAEIPGTVKFIFQPAEEMASDAPEWGGKLMVKEGALENPRPSAIFALHVGNRLSDNSIAPAGTIAYNEGPASANSDKFILKIRGKMAHGSMPQAGIDSIVVASAAVMQLQTIRSRLTDTQDPVVLTIGSFHGGNRENILAEEVEMLGTVRTYSDKVQDQVIKQMHQILKGVTESYGASYELNYEKGYPSVINNVDLVRRMLPTMERIVGQKNINQPRPTMGGEDFSYFAREIPGFMFWLGGSNEKSGFTSGNHTATMNV